MNRRVRITLIVLATLVQAAAADPLAAGQSGPGGGFAATAGLPLKGGPALTDDALRPLVHMPRLRALEIYHSRITEGGLAGLSACPKLQSVRIRSATAVPAPAVARLKAVMPQLQTLEIYPLASQAGSRPAPPMPALLVQ
jgi:hypothetical protein